jgi:hypothetical protein
MGAFLNPARTDNEKEQKCIPVDLVKNSLV